jgi:hypothetical protein
VETTTTRSSRSGGELEEDSDPSRNPLRHQHDHPQRGCPALGRGIQRRCRHRGSTPPCGATSDSPVRSWALSPSAWATWSSNPPPPRAGDHDARARSRCGHNQANSASLHVGTPRRRPECPIELARVQEPIGISAAVDPQQSRTSLSTSCANSRRASAWPAIRESRHFPGHRRPRRRSGARRNIPRHSRGRRRMRLMARA